MKIQRDPENIEKRSVVPTFDATLQESRDPTPISILGRERFLFGRIPVRA